MDAKEAGTMIGTCEFVAETVDKILLLIRGRDYESAQRYLEGLKKTTLAQRTVIRRMIK